MKENGGQSNSNSISLLIFLSGNFFKVILFSFKLNKQNLNKQYKINKKVQKRTMIKKNLVKLISVFPKSFQI